MMRGMPFAQTCGTLSYLRSGRSGPLPYRRILPPRPNYTIPNIQTQSLGSLSCNPEAEDLASTHNSQPDESRDADTWSPKRLRSRSSHIGQYTEADDSLDDSSESLNDDGDITSEEEMEEKEYDVEGIDGERIAPGVHEYLVRWVGYAERTWTASTDCSCPDIIADMRAVQSADLGAAIDSGREEEASILQQLRDAPQAKTKRARPLWATRSNQMRNKDDYPSNQTQSQATPSSVACLDTSCGYSAIKREPDLPREVRANTAWRRLGSAERDQENGSHYITWYRSKPIDVDGLIDIEQRVGPKSNFELVDAWRAGTVATEMEGVEEGWNESQAALRKNSTGQEAHVHMHHASKNSVRDLVRLSSPLSVDSSSSGHNRRRPSTTIASSLAASHTSERLLKDARELSNTIASQNSERRALESELRSISLFVKEAVDMGHDDLAAEAILGVRYQTPIKSEAEEERKLRKRRSERKLQSLLDDASLAAAPNSLIKRPNHALRRASSTFATGTRASKKDLRSTREHAARLSLAKKINLNTSRRQLDATSPKSVEEVVSHAKVLAVRMSDQ